MYDYRFIKPMKEKQNPGCFVVFDIRDQERIIAKCQTREDAEKIVKALNAAR